MSVFSEMANSMRGLRIQAVWVSVLILQTAIYCLKVVHLTPESPFLLVDNNWE